jgi:acyl-CoA thioesterase I
MKGAPTSCDAPAELIDLSHPLVRFADSVARGRLIKIVTIGSSSTAGDGASAPVATYPSQLQAELRRRLPANAVEVINKGQGGQEAPDEVARFKTDVIAEEPKLVIWQVGTNAVWKDYYFDEVEAAIYRGLGRLKQLDADVILMDLQYAPAVIDAAAKTRAEQMVALIASAAAKEQVGLFRRFALMRHWHVDKHIPFEQMISNFDGNQLHQNDWSYACVAKALAEAITYSIGSTA